jgi:hypothetical protein
MEMIEMKRPNGGIDHSLYLQSHVPHPACSNSTEIDEVVKNNFRTESGM